MSTRDATLAVWAALGALAVAAELAALAWRGRVPGIGAVLDRIGSNRVGRAALVLGWMWLGWHAFAR